jgi:hypothetical protein
MSAPGVGCRACPGLSKSKVAPAMRAAKTSAHIPIVAAIAILALAELEVNRSKILFTLIVQSSYEPVSVDGIGSCYIQLVLFFNWRGQMAQKRP